MKKILLFALCLLIGALPVYALSESNPEFPFVDDPFEERGDDDLETPKTDDELNIQFEIDGQSHTLAFDPSPEYSSVKDGMVQVSFFEYDDGRNTLYELYLIFPEDVRSEDKIDADYSIENDKDCSVVLIVSNSDSETYYVSGVMNRRLYPDGSSFSMDFDFVGDSGFAGVLTAQLVALDLSSGAVVDTLTIENAPFRFTMDGAATERHADPLPTEAPADLRRV